MNPNIHKCDTCGKQVVYSMFDRKWKHAQKTECKGGTVVLKSTITN